MKRTIMFLFVLLLSSTFGYTAQGRGGINWYTNYDQAVKVAQSSNKPVVLLFTGSDWCSWCQKLEEEVFNTPEFANAVDNRFVFVKIDFPMHSTLPPEISAQNKRLQKQFPVAGYPTVIVLDSHLKQLGTTGYRPGGGKAYADYLFQLVQSHTAYLEKVGNVEKNAVAGIDLKHLYEQAVELNRLQDADKIVSLGMSSDQKHFFMLERYRLLAEKGQQQCEESANIKQELLVSDPNNLMLTHYQVAVIDYEALCRANYDSLPPELTVASLVDYIDKFGNNDTENVWRLLMIVAQVYFDEDKLHEALEYAQSSYFTAPPTVQPEIATAIKNIRSRLLK
jgi:protein disulfide-isomerase